MTDNELLLAISDMMDKKLKPITKDVQDIQKNIKELEAKVENIDIRTKNIELTQETQIQPQLNTITSCYTDTYNRYKNYADKMETVFDDVELLKKVVQEHSQKLQNIS